MNETNAVPPRSGFAKHLLWSPDFSKNIFQGLCLGWGLRLKTANLAPETTENVTTEVTNFVAARWLLFE